jgi:hypothetical protein
MEQISVPNESNLAKYRENERKKKFKSSVVDGTE